jgi:hypothetical protein
MSCHLHSFVLSVPHHNCNQVLLFWSIIQMTFKVSIRVQKRSVVKPVSPTCICRTLPWPCQTLVNWGEPRPCEAQVVSGTRPTGAPTPARHKRPLRRIGIIWRWAVVATGRWLFDLVMDLRSNHWNRRMLWGEDRTRWPPFVGLGFLARLTLPYPKVLCTAATAAVVMSLLHP